MRGGGGTAKRQPTIEPQQFAFNPRVTRSAARTADEDRSHPAVNTTSVAEEASSRESPVADSSGTSDNTGDGHSSNDEEESSSAREGSSAVEEDEIFNSRVPLITTQVRTAVRQLGDIETVRQDATSNSNDQRSTIIEDSLFPRGCVGERTT